MLIYTENITPRHAFVATLLEKRLGIPFTFTTDAETFSIGVPVVNYHTISRSNAINIFDAGFLSSMDILSEPACNEHDIFPAPDKIYDFDFDLFSAAFWIVTRCEEYSTANTDFHNRYDPKFSLLYKFDWLQRPIVDEWIFTFGNLLSAKFGCELFPPQYRFLPTVDVDIAFAYRARPFWLSIARYGIDFFKRDFEAVKERFLVNTGVHEDPYNVFDYLRQLFAKTGIKPHIFFQVGARGQYDKNIYPFHPEMRNILQQTAQWAIVGLHPSYESYSYPERLTMEKKVLEKITGKYVFSCRQHYLKIKLPVSYRRFSEAGITEDFSLGYSSQLGFRAGTCHAYRFFDLNNNELTSLIIRPLMVMDVTLKDYLKLTPDQAIHQISAVVAVVRANHGDFSLLWHNSSFSKVGGWQQWKTVFEDALKIAAE
jgi:peptidoglycan/xylan/chitin deacetylase (PgdA/CDA1 family)